MISQKMNPEWKHKWIDALRSGKYKQTQHTMCSLSEDGTVAGDVAYCCLGVLRYISSGVQCRHDADAEGWEYYDDSVLTPAEESKFDIADEQIAILVNMNDDNDDNFDYIAGYIEDNL